MRKFRLLLVSQRPIIEAVFSSFKQLGPRNLEVNCVPPKVEMVSDRVEELSDVTVAVVDAVSDPVATVGVCKELRARNPSLPLLVLVTCSRSVSLLQSQALIDAGASGMLGPSVTPQEILSAVDRVAQGHIVFQLEHAMDLSLLGGLLSDYSGAKRESLFAGHEADLLQFVAQGLSDEEIGRRLHVSPPTVRRRMERLRKVTATNNRTELAGWAGSQGFYSAAQAHRADGVAG